jgi:hypothetical protein
MRLCRYIILFSLIFFGFTGLVSAQDAAPEGAAPAGVAREVRVLLLPVPTLEPGQDQLIRALVEGDHRLKRLWVELRPLGSEGAWEELPLRRGSGREFAAVAPRGLIQPPGLELRVLSEDLEGARQVHVERARVLVQGQTEERQVAERLAAHNGQRSTFRLGGDLTLYGRRLYLPPEGGAGVPATRYSDRFWVSEAEYTYRTLGFLYDIRFGLGAMRGERPVVDVDGEERFLDGRGEGPTPGLNYGWSEATLAWSDHVSTGFRLTLGASQEGFAAGFRGLLRVGSVASTHLEVGGELLQDAGNLGYLKFQWLTVPRVPMSMTIEIGERPDQGQGALGTRLMLEAGWQVTDQLQIGGRIGYAARELALEGGVVAGLHTAWSF